MKEIVTKTNRNFMIAIFTGCCDFERITNIVLLQEREKVNISKEVMQQMKVLLKCL